MKYNIQKIQNDQIILVHVSGKRDLEIDNLMVREVMQNVSETGIRKVLIDLRLLEFDLSTAEIFKRAMDMREQRLKHRTVSTKVALIYQPGDPKLNEDMRFFEIATQNRGVPYRVFTDIEKAKAWLLDE